MKGRICLECEHCFVDAGSHGYSEYTPGEGMSFFCDKGVVFDFSPANYDGNKRTLLNDLRKAEICEFFKEENQS